MTKPTSSKAIFLSCVFCFATAIAARAQTFTTLASFDFNNGYMPWSMTLIQGTDGNFCGTTWGGGAYGAGTVFRVTPSGELTALYSFCAQTGCPDGKAPLASLVQAADGNFYGTTSGGGANNYGTIFRITPEGVLTTLHSFNGTDGWGPGPLIQASNGNFYGGTDAGGNIEACPTSPGCGTIFEITAAGEFSVLHTFDGSDGAGAGAVIQGNDGNFYGVTGGGGLDDCPPYPGCGTVFEMTPAGNLTTLYTFHGTDGWMPELPLVQATDGNFYGTTVYGGNISVCYEIAGCGTVFEITPQGELTTLHSFDFTDGSGPSAPLIQATDGNLYGTTVGGGPTGVPGTMTNPAEGTIFEITLEGALTTLYGFTTAPGYEPTPDGAVPTGGLVQATDGNFYGTAMAGGNGPNCGVGGCGTVFSLSVGLDPFVKTVPTSGERKATIMILGTDLTGATSVTFNGKAAAFTIVLSSEIRASVPADASTGKVEVATPHGTLTSNVPFRVLLQGVRPGGIPIPRPY